MKSLRLWISLLALTSFLVGIATGSFLGVRTPKATITTEARPFTDYEQLLADRFRLAPERVDELRHLLANYHTEIERTKDVHMADYMTSMEPELSELARKYRGFIRDHVLPEDGRAAFDQLLLGVPVESNSPQETKK